MNTLQEEKNMLTPVISVIIPVYNAEKTVKKCLDSVINQSYKSLEIIVVIDGATDNSLNICRELESQDKRINIYATGNQGVSKARNFALSHATGDYICFVDSDDWIEFNMFENMIDCGLKHNADIVVQPIVFEGLNITRIAKSSKNERIMSGREATIEMLKGELFSGQLCNKMFKKACADGLFCDPKVFVYEDILALWNIMPLCKTVVYQDKYCYHYIMNQSSAMHQPYNQKYSTAKIVADRVLSDAKETFPESVPYAKKLSIIIYRTVMHRAYLGKTTGNSLFKNEYREFKECVNENFDFSVRSIIGFRESMKIRIESGGIAIFCVYRCLHNLFASIKRAILSVIKS